MSERGDFVIFDFRKINITVSRRIKVYKSSLNITRDCCSLSYCNKKSHHNLLKYNML